MIGLVDMSPMVEQLREELQQKDQVIAELDAQLKAQQIRMEQLQQQMNELLRRVYGRKSEKLDPNQLLIEEMILDADGADHLTVALV